MSRFTRTVTNTEQVSVMLSPQFIPLAGHGKVFPSLTPGPAISTFGNLSIGNSGCNNNAMEIDVHLLPNVNESASERIGASLAFRFLNTRSH
jgi:hypothetical protein